MITPARIININKPIVPAVIQKEPISVISDRSKYIQDYVFRIKSYLEDDLEIVHLSHIIDIQIINTNSSQDYFVRTPMYNDDMYIIYINKYTIDKKIGIFGIDYYLKYITICMSMAMRSIFQYYNLNTCGMTMEEYIDSEDISDEVIDEREYSKLFTDLYKIDIERCIRNTIETVHENTNYFNMTRWIYYVINTCKLFNEIISNVQSAWCMSYIDIAYRGIELEKDQYYNLSCDTLHDTILIEFNIDINCNSIDEIIEYTKSLLIYSLCDIMNEFEIDESMPVDIDILNQLISDNLDYELRCMFADYTKFGGR